MKYSAMAGDNYSFLGERNDIKFVFLKIILAEL
jgi:hypothetical protein